MIKGVLVTRETGAEGVARGVAVSVPDSGIRGVGNIMPLPIYPQERNLIPSC